MSLQPVARSSVSGAVYEQLSGEILAGRYDAGQALPAERILAELLGVNRGAVREAIQRLAGAGLVESRQGAGTVVLDYRLRAGLDLLPALLVGEEGVDAGAVRSVAELRACIGADAARLAAGRADAAARQRLEACGRALAQAPDLAARQAASLAMWEAVVDASDNIAYRLAMNSLRRAYEPVQEMLRGVLSDELDDVDGHQAVIAAVLAGRPEDALQRARTLLARGGDALAAIALALGGRP